MVNSILQDKMGYMWFGTFNGLERYDGYDIISYGDNFDDTSSVENPFITTLYEDKEGILWVGTWHGLEKFERLTGTFRYYTPDSSASGFGSDLSNMVHAIHDDIYGALWVGTSNGLYKYNKNTGKFICFLYDSTNPGSISHNIISAIYEDKEGSLWFGTGAGLDKLDFKTGKFKHFWNDSSNRGKLWANLSKHWINAIYGDNSGTIWMGTNGGLVEFNRKSGTFINYIPNPNVKQVTMDNCITSICMDASGGLWLGTTHGLYTFDIKTKEFIASYFHDDEPGSLSGNAIYSVYVEGSETLWIGTFGGGVNKINLRKNYFKRYLTHRAVSSIFKEKDALFINTSKGWIKFNPFTEKVFQYSFGKDKLIYKEDSGDLWFIDKKGSLYKKDKQGNSWYMYNKSGRIFNKRVTYICKAREGFWIGTDQCGLYFFDPVTKRIREANKIKQAISIVYEDSFGLVWISPWMQKLFCYNPMQDSITEFISDPKIPGSISGQQTRDIYEDKKGRLWFGTNTGLNRYDRLTQKFIHFTGGNEPVHSGIFAILEDEHGSLWLNTDKGISKFNPEKYLFKNFYIPGWIPRLYEAHSKYKTSNGEMYFTGSNGFIRFHPDSIKANLFIPPVVITSFKKFDHSYPLKKEIHLSYNENFISFEFAALNYVDPEKNQYAYKMEGIDKEWVFSGTRRYASYTSLPPGEYTFRVKGSNNDGVWNEQGTSVSIIISPPWWETVYAYILYALIIISIVYFTWRLQLERIRVKQGYEMSKFEADKLHEVDELKSRFFTNISHEFRTPLTLILGPVKQMIESTKDERNKNELQVVHKNAKNLLGLVNELLDISKLESGNMKLKTNPQNIIPLLKALVQSFCSYAERKRINLKFNSNEEEIIVYIDKEKIEKIITNLLSNAFKFTPEEGEIEVRVNIKYPFVRPWNQKEEKYHFGGAQSEILTGDREIFSRRKIFPPTEKIKYKAGGGRNDNDTSPSLRADVVEISICDNGIGISKENISKIFDRFYQVNGNHTRELEGTGIGLSLTKELVELHKGKISVESVEGRGSIFKILLPLGKEHLQPDEICEAEKADAFHDLENPFLIDEDETDLSAIKAG
ncbi:MAG: two-component regulator propeller domain-containing protein, partial [Ignavibacteriaceae bacterium]